MARKHRIAGIKRRWHLFLVNHVYAGTEAFERKRALLNSIGHEIGEGTRIVGPIECSGTLSCGRDCWIGKNFRINGNGRVRIGDRCDIGPEVTFQTGGHKIGPPRRRAGEGYHCIQSVGSGTWIGGGATIVENTSIGASCVIAACACVNRDLPDNVLAGGVPARIIRELDHEAETPAEIQNG